MEKNVTKVRAHDAIVGILYLISAGLTLYTSNLNFLWIAVAVGVKWSRKTGQQKLNFKLQSDEKNKTTI